MSVLIKGMKMPFSCLVCPCSGEDNTDDGNEVWVCEASELRQLTVEDKIVHRPEWCPLVPVPPHCEYCNEDADGFVTPLEKNGHAFVRFGINGWELSLRANGWHGSAKIRYCPMCGRDLFVK